MKSRIILASLLSAAAAGAQPGATQHQQDQDAATAPDPQSDEPSEGPEANAMLPVKLNDLIMVAIRLAPDLARARIDRTTAMHAAAASHHTQSWMLTSSVNYSANGVSDQTEAPPYSIVEQDTLSATLGLMRNLPTGGSITFNSGVQSQHTEYSLLDTTLQAAGSASMTTGTAAASSSMPTAEDAYNMQASVGISVKQPLWRGLGSIAVADIRRSELQATESTIKAQLAAEDLVKDIVTAYWELAYSSFEVDVRVQALELARKQEALTHEQIRSGTAAPSTVNAVVFEIMTREEAKLRAETDLEQKSMDLRQKAGLELTQRQIVLRPSDPFEIGQEEFDVGEVLEKSRMSNRKLATIQIEKKVADVDVLVAEDAAKPQMDLTLSGALIGMGDSVGDSFSGIGDRDAYQISLGINMSFELSGAARRGKDAALAKRRRLEIDRADAQRQIESQTALSVKAVASARARVELEDKAIAVAEDNVRSERAQFLVARTTNYNVMQRQSELIDARLKRGRAVADYHIAVAQLQYLSGLLLEQYGIDVKAHDAD
jgi:outer membrane protein TolC